MPIFIDRRTVLVAAIALASQCVGVRGHGAKSGSLLIVHPWDRATPAGQKVGAGNFRVVKTGAVADRLVGASIDGAAMAEFLVKVLKGARLAFDGAA